MLDILLYIVRVIVVLVLVLVVLALFGVSPTEAGRAVGDALASVGDFFEAIRREN